MNKEIKKKWVEALRSGKYEQGKGRLRGGDAFCCLGVLCDIADPEGWAEGRGGLYLHGGNRGALSEEMCNGLCPF